MKPLMHRLFFTLLLLSTITLNVRADTCPGNMQADCGSGIMKDAGESTTDIVKAAHPNVLVCMPSGDGVDAGDVIGKVIAGTEPGSSVCEYPRFINATVVDTQVTAKFDWLDTTYEQLATWLTSFAHIEKNGNSYYYVSKSTNQSTGQLDICVQSTPGKGFEFGYETVSDNGQKSCGLFVGALYLSPFFRTPGDQTDGDRVSTSDRGSDRESGSNSYSDEDDFCSKCESESFHSDCPRCECSVEKFSTKCDLCNGNGCGIFRCSLFTGWADCPENSHVCDHITCPGFSCPKKPVCCRKRCHKKPAG